MRWSQDCYLVPGLWEQESPHSSLAQADYLEAGTQDLKHMGEEKEGGAVGSQSTPKCCEMVGQEISTAQISVDMN
jgi:hypothetical protein